MAWEHGVLVGKGFDTSVEGSVKLKDLNLKELQNESQTMKLIRQLQDLACSGGRDKIMAKITELNEEHAKEVRELNALKKTNANLTETIERLHDVTLEDELCRCQNENDKLRKRVSNLRSAIRRRKKVIRKFDARIKRQSYELSLNEEQIKALLAQTDNLKRLLSLARQERDEYRALAEEANEKVTQLVENSGIFGTLAGWRRKWTCNS